ncbi:MAG: hypothetical protein NC186_06650 [Prevotella sp.]|nr:hypothetical protein [Prevotella sp.]
MAVLKTQKSNALRCVHIVGELLYLMVMAEFRLQEMYVHIVAKNDN